MAPSFNTPFLLLTLLSAALLSPVLADNDARLAAIQTLFQDIEAGNLAGIAALFAPNSTYFHEGGDQIPGLKSFTSNNPLVDHLVFQEQYWKINSFGDVILASDPSTGHVLVNFALDWNFLPTGKRVQESCFLRYSFDDRNLITENYESCNSLAEYEATIPDAQSCSPGLNGCYNAQGTKLTCCPGQCGPYADNGNTATCA